MDDYRAKAEFAQESNLFSRNEVVRVDKQEIRNVNDDILSMKHIRNTIPGCQLCMLVFIRNTFLIFIYKYFYLFLFILIYIYFVFIYFYSFVFIDFYLLLFIQKNRANYRTIKRC